MKGFNNYEWKVTILFNLKRIEILWC